MSAGARGRDRRHSFPARNRHLFLRCTDEEYGDIAAAASRAGLTPSGYAAEAAVATARGTRPPAAEPWREALAEVMAARTQLRRFGTNVNQAVRALNATGEAPAWLERAVGGADQAVAHLDAAAQTLFRRLS